MIDQIFKARKNIIRHSTKTESQEGIIKCPICKNDLHYNKVQDGALISAKCNTKGCIYFNEVL